MLSFYNMWHPNTIICVCFSGFKAFVCLFVMPLFGKSHKSPADIVKSLKENLAVLVKHDKKTDKVGETEGFICNLLDTQWPEGDGLL